MDCPQIPQLSYGEFSERLRRKVTVQRIPAVGSLELTFRCNFRCKHCYVSHGHRGIAGQQELTTAEIKQFLDDIVSEGCLWLLITGGDPLVRQDFPEIWEYAKRKGLILTLFTNGSLITPRIADFLQEWKPYNIEIKLYGATSETYERVTGIPNSFERAMHGIELLRERNIQFGLKTMVLTLNRHEFAQIRSIAQKFDVPFRFDPIVNQGLETQLDLQSLRLPIQDILELDAEMEPQVKAWYNQYLATRSNNSPDLYICQARHRSFHVDPYGNVGICTMERVNRVNLRQASFHEIWWEYHPKMFSRQYSSTYECQGCEMRSVCMQCPAWGYLEHNDPEKRVMFICKLTKLRVERTAQMIQS